ncbi:MAG: efflux RND transporter periplasmic adaptor subunit [Planctomycetota bacterium]
MNQAPWRGADWPTIPMNSARKHAVEYACFVIEHSITIVRGALFSLFFVVCGLPGNAQFFGGSDPIDPAVKESATFGYDGFTEPKFDLMVAATEIGRMDEVLVQVGDRIKRGQTVARLEDGLQREAVATATWRASMHGETDAASAEVAIAKLRLEQLQTLAEREMARPDELKRALADWEVAKSRELAAREQDKLRELELERYKLQLARRVIKSPMDGVVAEIFHQPGEYVTPGDPAVIRLLVIDQIYAVFNIPAEDLDKIVVGREVPVYLNSSRLSVRGSIHSMSPGIDGESGTIRIRVLLDNADGRLRSGDRCRLKLNPPRNARLPIQMKSQGAKHSLLPWSDATTVR